VIQIVPELSKRLPAQRTGGLYKTQSQQGWPGRPILEYDSWIQGCKGYGPNFEFFNERFIPEICAGKEPPCNEYRESWL
jgi:hypothetical protein